MPDGPEFQQKQYAFAAHIRDPDGRPAPAGIEDRRMAIYRELFFNNLRSLLGTFFPVLRKIHSRGRWQHLIREFMRRHRATTPYFLRLPEEFVAFLSTEYETREDDVPFLAELAHYEYAELAVSTAEDPVDDPDVDPAGDLLTDVPVKSPLAQVHAYRWPVHRIGPDFLPDEPLADPLYLVVYRRSDLGVGFMELNAVTAALLQAIAENSSGDSGRKLLCDIADALQYGDADAFVTHGAAAMEEMRALGIIIGARAA